MKILHLASYDGNIGDNANIYSVQKSLKNLDPLINFTQLEMRDFYWKKKFFNDDLVDYVNTFDAFIIGGGNYFELWVESSRTGMSIDIPIELLEKIKVPVVFYSLGFDIDMGYSQNNLLKAGNWFSYVCSHPERYLLSVRNDGSLENLDKLFGQEIASKVRKVPDGGFLYQSSNEFCSWINHENLSKTIAVNLTGDMLEIRFPGNGSHTIDSFLVEFANYVSMICTEFENISFVFVAHIYKDLDVYSRLFSLLPDETVRLRCTVAPYVHGLPSYHDPFFIYKNALLILGARFHANVCPIAMEVPVIGLVNYPQISYLYKELSLSQYSVNIRKFAFKEELFNKSSELIKDSKQYRGLLQKISAGMKKQLSQFNVDVIRFIS